MLNKFIRLMALVIAIIMVAVSASGCGKAGNSSDSSDWSDFTQDNGENIDNNNSDQDNTDSQNGATNSNIASGNGNTNSNVGSGANKKIEYLVDPEKYRGTTVTFVTWEDPDKNEGGPVIKNFEKKYGINVEIQMVSSWEYVSLIAASIASGKQGDIFFENGSFPGSLSVMQPLDAAKINFKDPIWDQQVIRDSTLDGHPYLVDAISNVWSEVDVCVYNKKIFEDNNINSPADYYAAGVWTFENFRKCAQDVAALGSNYLGAGAIGEVALAAAGASIYSYENNQMKNTVNDHTYEVLTFLAQMHDEGLIAEGNGYLGTGKTGMELTNIYALKKAGYFPDINPDHLGVTYLPTWKKGGTTPYTAMYRGWGLIKGAKNPVAAGIFLREYLDVNNYDLEETFHSPDVANFFFQITGATPAKVQYYHTDGMIRTVDRGQFYQSLWKWHSASQIKGIVQADINVINSVVKDANELINKERKWLKENYK